MIRYFFLNALKLNLVVMITYKRIKDEPFSILLATLILIVILIIPMVLSRVIYARKENLHEVNNSKAFGTVYQGRNLEN